MGWNQDHWHYTKMFYHWATWTIPSLELHILICWQGSSRITHDGIFFVSHQPWKLRQIQNRNNIPHRFIEKYSISWCGWSLINKYFWEMLGLVLPRKLRGRDLSNNANDRGLIPHFPVSSMPFKRITTGTLCLFT